MDEPERTERQIRCAFNARSSVPGETQRIRDWARAEGIEVSTRGRISAEVREAYLKANAS